MASFEDARLSPAFFPGRYGFWLLAFVPALLVALLFAVLYLVPAARFTRHGQPVTAHVIGTPCADGRRVSYAFELEGREITSSTLARNLDLPCSALAVGTAVSVVYLPNRPQTSVGAAGLPRQLRTAIVATVVGFLVTFVGIVVLVSTYARDAIRTAERDGA